MSNLRRRGGEGLRFCSAVLAVAACFFLACTGWSAESKPESNALPVIASVPATNALAAFRVRPGFRLELVAAEPLVASPIAMAFDENNRLFVVERSDDSDPPGTNSHSSRIRLLEDTAEDGEFHSSTIYADNLPWASAVACYGGGVFVATGPDIVFLKDTKTNGIAEVRKAIFTSFTGTNLFGAPALPNNFNWGLDNRIHAASAGVAAFVPGSSAPGALLVPLTGADFAFDPRALTICAEAGPAQSGLTFDDWGRKLICDPTRPLRSPRYELRYLARNPFFPPPPQMLEVASPATAIYRLLSVQRPAPAREPAHTTNELVRAVAPVTTMLATTWLTNAQSCVIYRGNAYPPNYLGNAFIADPSAHVVHRAVLRESGQDATAVRAPDEKDTEFILSSDPAFRPMQIINGPDGALYVADMRDGHDRGRIYRVVPVGFKRPEPALLGKATTYGLVANLSHPNGWQRDTAARLLYERRDGAAPPLLASLLDGSPTPLARLHALHVLAGLGALTPAHLRTGFRDLDQHVREHAVRLAETLVKDGALPDVLWNQLRLMAADPSIRVRCQLALTMGEIRRPEKAQVLAGLFLLTPDNPSMQAAILSSLADGAGDLFVTLAGDPRVRGNSVGWEFLLRMANMIGVQARPAEAAQVLGFIDQAQLDPQQAFPLLCALGDGLHRARSSLALIDSQNRCQRYYSLASDAVMNYLGSEPIQVEAIRLIGVGPYTVASIGDLLLLLLGSGQSEAIQSAVIATLGRFDDSRIAPAMIRRWNGLAPRLRNEAVAALLTRTSRVGAVLTALETGQISGADLSFAQVNFLRTHRDPAFSRRALQLFGPVPRQRPEAVRRFRPALGLKGAAERGRGIFVARCAACHQPSGASQTVGPHLISARIYGKERTLRAILEPNAEVRRDYLTYAVETAEGDNFIDLLRRDNEAAVTLQQLNGRPVVLPRTNIQYLQAQPWSLMPEGLEEGLTPQGMADLLEYIFTTTP
jgi:putative membrane-bound dehydrogenase-like protein